MAGTIYATKEELTEAVVKLVYPNTTKSVTALGNQTAILNVVESIWAQLGSGGAGDLQAVLDLGSLAVIPGDFDVTANGTRLWITNGGIISSGLSFSFTSNSGGFNHLGVSSPTSGSNLSVSDNGYALESKLSDDVVSRLSCSPNGFNASMKNSNNGGVAMSIIGNPENNSGYKVSREYSPTNDATALWDIDGDLRVRTLNDGAADTEMLTVDANGKVNKVPIPEDSAPSTYELKDTLPGYTLTEKKNYSFTCVNSSNMDIFLPNASATHKGEWMLTLTNSVYGGTMTIQGLDSISFGASYNSGVLAELTTVIIRCVEVLDIGSTPVYNYKWIEVARS
jgi:hypothetical protein